MSLLSMASVSATPLVISGTALTPPLPVLAMTPGPSRLNQVSNVNDCAPIGDAAPNVTRLFVPLNFSAVFTTTALTVMVTLLLLGAPLLSVAVRLSTYVPAVENVAVVASAVASVNVTVPGPLTLLHRTDTIVPSGSLAVPASEAVAGNVIV